MIREKVKSAGEWIEDQLRQLCGAITPDKRVVVVFVFLLGFAALSLYFTFSSIYHFGQGDGTRLQMRHIEQLKMELQQRENELDSMKFQNMVDYERAAE